jgi:two-component system sensor histidine kinase MprB
VTLRARLALLFGAFGLVASTLVGVLAFRETRSELRASTDEFLRDRAAEITSGVRSRPGRLALDLARDRPGDRPSFDPDALTQIVGPQGAVLASSSDVGLPVTEAVAELASARPGPGRTLVDFDDVEIDGESYRMIVEALPVGGAVQVARSIEEDEDVLADLRRRYVLIAALVASAGVGLGWLVASRATRPLRRLAATAADVADTGDFTTPVDVGGDDEIGRLAAGFREMLDALERSREQQHRLVHDAGHELRTPLTSLRANVGLLERAGDLPPDQRAEVLAAISAELVELGDLFDELIDLATDHGDRQIAEEPVDLVVVVERATDRLSRRTDRVVTLDASPTTVRGDESMLERAVTNLLANADKFSPPGTPIAVEVGGGAVIVRDRGPGIPVEDRSRVFDRFYRSDATRTMPGSGLGLAIVAQIVERHGGSVWATDRADGGGAEVGFRLPELAGVTDR